MLEECVVSGLVQTCDPVTSDLTVRLEDGTLVRVPYAEITRQANLSPLYAARQVGRTLRMVPAGEGVCSVRAYEQRCYDEILTNFRNKTKNVYPARFKLIAQGGKLAFYSLAQGVNGAIHVKEFTSGRIDDFNRVIMPRELRVIVRDIDEQGHLVLTAKPAFGSFSENIERLQLSEGNRARGIVCHQFPQSVGVMLSPNVMTLADSSATFHPGDCVEVEVTRIDFDTHKIRSTLCGTVPSFSFRYEDWLIGQLGEYVDMDAYADSINVRKNPPMPVPAQKLDPPSFALDAEKSPFSTFPQEKVLIDAASGMPAHALRTAHLDPRIPAIAQAVETLHFTTGWQLQRFLYLTQNLLIERGKLNSLLDRLTSLDVLGTLRFESGGVACKFKTYYPGANYHALCERYPRNFRLTDLATLQASNVKSRLASNQLFLGLLHSGSFTSWDCHPYLFDREHNLRVRPKHMLTGPDRTLLIDSYRTGMWEDFQDKLTRYDQYYRLNPAEGVELCVSVEDDDQAALRKHLQSASLCFPVCLTTDLGCLPEPVFETVTPSRRGFFAQLLHRLR